MFAKQKQLIVASTPSLMFFLLDRVGKYIAQSNPEYSWYIIEHWLGWEYHANPGVAFGIPVAQNFLLVATPLLLIVLSFFFFEYKLSRTPLAFFAWSLIFFGAISNYIDRFAYSVTIDYIRVTTSILNIADIMIVVGGVLLLWKFQKK